MSVIGIRLAGVSKDSEGNEKQITSSEALALQGPCIPGALTFSTAQQQAIVETSPNEGIRSVVGLILFDTGASTCCFDLEVAGRKANMNSASHAGHPAPLFAGKLIINDIAEVERAMGAALQLIALIGRDFAPRYAILSRTRWFCDILD